MRAAKVENGIVQNVIVADEIPAGFVECPDYIGIGMSMDAVNPDIAENERKAAMRELELIDLRSIRSIREYIASLPDAHAFLKNYETQAQAARAKLPK